MINIAAIDWKSFNTLLERIFQTKFVSIENLCKLVAKENWLSVPNWENLDDIQLYNLLEKIERPQGDLYVVTEAAYRKSKGPFCVSSDEIRGFVEEHLNTFGECFFNGDVLILSVDQNTIWIFHHEGVYSTIKAESGQPLTRKAD